MVSVINAAMSVANNLNSNNNNQNNNNNDNNDNNDNINIANLASGQMNTNMVMAGRRKRYYSSNIELIYLYKKRETKIFIYKLGKI